MSTRAALEERVERYRPLILDELRGALRSEPTELFGWMRYHLGWEDEHGDPAVSDGGKLLRPVAVLLAAEACGAPVASAVPAAAAVELVHNFSLLHDDVEDRSERRRNRATLWTLTGTAQAINTGDGMFALAHSVLHRLREGGVSAERTLASMHELDEACVRLVIGQHLDMAYEGSARVARGQYVEMIGGKTAALFAASFAMGGLVAGAEPRTVDALRGFGEHVGLAFQAVDDLLGIWGEPEVTGKPVGDDLLARKHSLPVIVALEADGEAAATVAHAYDGPEGAPIDVPTVARAVEEAGGRAATEDFAADAVATALGQIARIGLPEPEREALEAYAERARVRES